MQGRICVIEDDQELAQLMSMYLEREGMAVTCYSSAEHASQALELERFDLITLDINLPGKDGFEFLQELRRRAQTPVMILSAREADEDIILGLGIGADEFLTKPVPPRVLVARIRAMLRRLRNQTKAKYRFLDFSLDLDGYLLLRNNERISLSAKEFEVLGWFCKNPGVAFSAEDLYRAVWGERFGDLSIVGVYIQRLRKKLEVDPSRPQLIETVSGRGYRFNKELLKVLEA